MNFHHGDVVLVNFNPIRGHEQGNARPALVINAVPMPGGLSVVLPITSKPKTYPLVVHLDERTKTQGNILCFQIRTIDLNSRSARFLERVPEDILDRCVDYVKRLIEKD